MGSTPDGRNVELPAVVVQAIDRHTGPATHIRPVTAGFTPGAKYLIETTRGAHYFVKSAPMDSWVGRDYATEADAHQWLPATATRSLLSAHITVGGYHTLIFHGLQDRNPGASLWADEAEVTHALRSLVLAYSEIDAAAPEDLASSVATFWPEQTFWRDCISGRERRPDDVPEHVVGEFADLEGRALHVLSRPEWGREVCHEDLRRDQFVIESDGTATIVDWSFVTRTPRIVDAVSLGVGVSASGLDAEIVLRKPGPFWGYDAADINPVLAALAGYFHRAARVTKRKPDHLRRAQRVQADAATRWLLARLGR